jgi:hypothetical protein
MVMTFLTRMAALATAFVLVAAAFLFAMPAAHAQGPMPYGLWRGENSGDHILVRSNRSCQVNSRVSYSVAGPCQWTPSYPGGNLTIFYPMPRDPGRVSWSIIWIDQNTLWVNNIERFRRLPVTSY